MAKKRKQKKSKGIGYPHAEVCTVYLSDGEIDALLMAACREQARRLDSKPGDRYARHGWLETAMGELQRAHSIQVANWRAPTYRDKSAGFTWSASPELAAAGPANVYPLLKDQSMRRG